MKISIILLFLSNFAVSFAADYYQPAPGESNSDITSVTKCFRQYIQTTHKGHLKQLRIKNRIMEIHRTPNEDFIFVISKRTDGFCKKTDIWFLTIYDLNSNIVNHMTFKNQIKIGLIENTKLIFYEVLEYKYNFHVFNLLKNTQIVIKDVPRLFAISPDNNFLAYVTKKEHRSESSIYFHDLTNEKSIFCLFPLSTTNSPILPEFDWNNKCTITFRNNSVDDVDEQFVEITKDEINKLFTLSDREAHNYLKKKYKKKNNNNEWNLK